jgi:hypothetical protein
MFDIGHYSYFATATTRLLALGRKIRRSLFHRLHHADLQISIIVHARIESRLARENEETLSNYKTL